MFLPLSSSLGRLFKHLLVVTWMKAKDFGSGIRRSCALAALCERRTRLPTPRGCASPTFAAGAPAPRPRPTHGKQYFQYL